MVWFVWAESSSAESLTGGDVDGKPFLNFGKLFAKSTPLPVPFLLPSFALQVKMRAMNRCPV